jgi:hypothetical protein
MANIFRDFNYNPVGSEPIRGWLPTLQALAYPRQGAPRDHVYKAVALHAAWTVILDPELVMVTEEEACARLASRTRAPVFSMICEGASGTYSFSLLDPDVRRAYMSVAGEVQDDRGAPLPEEAGIDLARIFEDDVLLVMERLGVPYAALELAPSFDVWTLDESHMHPEIPRPGPSQATYRPWWKLW